MEGRETLTSYCPNFFSEEGTKELETLQDGRNCCEDCVLYPAVFLKPQLLTIDITVETASIKVNSLEIMSDS